MTFDEYMKRPVYVVQCTTARKAKELGLSGFQIRVTRGHRDVYCQAARDMVALSVRMDRARARLLAC